MADITERDIDIFRILSSGPATFVQIKSLLKRVYRSEVSQYALYKRLSILRKDKLIISRQYRNRDGKGRFVLYGITPLSVQTLVTQGYAVERIRTNMPSELTVAHEMAVTDVVRAIKRESARYQYDFTFLDENTLKEMYRGKRKKIVYPDLLVNLVFNTRPEPTKKQLAVEIDNSTILASKLFEKMKKMKWTTLMLCTTTMRINVLRKKFMIDEDLYGKVFFALLSEFCPKGFIGTSWMTIDGGNATILSPNLDMKASG